MQQKENIPPHVLRYVAEVSRIASGVWYRGSFGVDARPRKFLPHDGVMLPDFSIHENRVSAKMLDVIRRNGKCTLQYISRNFSHSGIDSENRLKIIAALIESGFLQCSGDPGECGSQYWI